MNEELENFRSRKMQLAAALSVSIANKAIYIQNPQAAIVIDKINGRYSINYINQKVLELKFFADAFDDIDEIIAENIPTMVTSVDLVWCCL